MPSTGRLRGLGVLLATLLLAAAASLLGVGTSGSPSSHALAPVTSTLRLPRLLGRTEGQSLPDVPSPYYGPPRAHGAGLALPATTILSGRDAPDGFIYLLGRTYYLFSSQGTHGKDNIPVVSGTKIGQWGPTVDAMPRLPRWVLPGFTWAPDLHRYGREWVLYFTAAVAGATPAMQCIGEAVGHDPTGPFVGLPTPMICQKTHHGSIDPRTFTDVRGVTWMIWKSDDNADVTGTSLTKIYSQRLSSNGLLLLGRPTRIFGPDEPWEGRIVEAPQLILVGQTYWLFYSGGWFNQAAYAVGAAKCRGPLGPCADVTPAPFLSTNYQGQGPGEQAVFRAPGGVYIVYAPFRSYDPTPTPPRPVVMARLGFGPNGPYLASPLSPVASGGP